jgi:GTP pyrophosphokinase
VQVYDIVALRVIISDNDGADTLAAIRAAYSVPPIAHRIWKSVASEFDDYILSPKKSGYQSIHLAAIAPEGVPLEVQV